MRETRRSGPTCYYTHCLEGYLEGFTGGAAWQDLGSGLEHLHHEPSWCRRGPVPERRLLGALDVATVVGGWISDLATSTNGTRPEPLLDAYHELCATVLRLASVMEVDRPEDARSLARAVARVAAECRRAGLTISDALTDVGLLRASALRSLKASGPDAQGSLVVDAVLRLDAHFRVALLRLVRALEATSLRAAREREDALAAMADQLSHELRNRLGAARTASQMLFTPDIDLDRESLTRVGDLVQSSVEAALHTVGDVRELVASRLHQGKREPRTMPLARLVRGVIEDLSPSALDVGVELEVEGDKLGCLVDAARLRLIVFNLIGNGIKYRDRERKVSRVTVATRRRRDGRVELTVSDNGIGIPPEDVEDIFLYHGRGSETGGVPGSGLGLAIAREAAEQIGGEIEVKSRVGEGSDFVVTFSPVPEGDD